MTVEAVETSALTFPTVGDVLREWRKRRRLSQLSLALDAGISTRHLSFVESGRSSPSREVLMKLATTLSMPRRAQNRLMLSAGYAPVHTEAGFETEELSLVRATVEAILDAQMPFPALAVDSRWTLIRANEAVTDWMKSIHPQLLKPPINVLRLSFHPDGLAPFVVNFSEWRHHVLERLQAQFASSGDTAISELEDELAAYPSPTEGKHSADHLHSRLAVPLILNLPEWSEPMKFISTTTVFSTATSVTASELALECFYPADDATRTRLLRS